MSAGGYIYEQVDLAYDAGTNGVTVRSWALAVHLARCRAFYLAAQREAANFGGSGWSSVQTNLYNEFSEYQDGVYYYIQDIHPTSVDTSAEYPAFVTFFERNNSSEEYCIITYGGFTPNATYANPTTYYNYGLYINVNNLQNSTSSNEVMCGESMAHAFSKNGFGSYDVANSNLITSDSTSIMAAYSPKSCSTTSYALDTASLIGARKSNQSNSLLVSHTYQFGFAIKGTQIISIMRRDDSVKWLWSIIGEIIGTTINDGDTHLTACVVNDYTAGQQIHETSSSTVSSLNTGSMSGRISMCKTDGSVYRPGFRVETDITRYYGNCISTCARTNNQVPTDTRYNAVAIGATYSIFNTNIGDTGIDGNCNGCKGFINTDILRQVPGIVCQKVGAVFQGGNFVAMRYEYSSGYGFILGWDSSNQSIM